MGVVRCIKCASADLYWWLLVFSTNLNECCCSRVLPNFLSSNYNALGGCFDWHEILIRKTYTIHQHHLRMKDLGSNKIDLCHAIPRHLRGSNSSVLLRGIPQFHSWWWRSTLWWLSDGQCTQSTIFPCCIPGGMIRGRVLWHEGILSMPTQPQ